MFMHFYLAIFIIFLFIQSAFSSIIKYEEILENPTDLELTLNYAKQQEEAGNFKLTIATLERMIMLYPTNPDIKIYLLSILIKMDSPAKVELMVQSMINDPNTKDETKNLQESNGDIKSKYELNHQRKKKTDSSRSNKRVNESKDNVIEKKPFKKF